MYVLGGFKLPLQETHKWHIQKWNFQGSGLHVPGTDTHARFDVSHGFGLFHMPLIGGLTKYVVIETNNFTNHWYIGWTGSIHLLKIKQNRIRLLTGKTGYKAFGLNSDGKALKIKIAGFGKIGDGQYNGVRLF